MKFFIDSADIQEIREAHSLGLIDGTGKGDANLFIPDRMHAIVVVGA